MQNLGNNSNRVVLFVGMEDVENMLLLSESLDLDDETYLYRKMEKEDILNIYEAYRFNH